MEQPHSSPQTPSTTNSPEFEFWMLRNPSLPQPNLLSADQLFSGGFLLPLHLLHLSPEPPPKPTEATEPESKRWRHLFKKNAHAANKERDFSHVKKSGGAVNKAVSAAELNINIWPFSRSRSAGSRPRPAAVARKASSAPCSRSNSAGESKARRWAHSPNRAGVHLGRSSPVWQLRGGREKVAKRDGNYGLTKAGGSKARVLSLNVPTCIGYRNHLSCGYGEGRAGAGSGSGGVSGEVIRRSHLFSIRSLFSKKVH
ncbi:uncharacterized protein LOC125213027 [Salvia hispanica]|uniref:uncharacterized protein LOC125213027 n=1 Tax=Salvia hispanica TaxID=49212 RepID=UPI002009D349|nr:uncharacterized protein LOC125213027 [Salvia hispanica]